MVDHRQDDRAHTEATVYDRGWVEDPDLVDGGYYEDDVPVFEADVAYQSGGQGWVPEGGGSRVYRNPTLDWPPKYQGDIEEGQEVSLEIDNHEQRYQIVNINPTYGRYGELSKLSVEVTSV